MTNKGLREVAKIITAVVGAEMEVVDIEHLCNCIYTGIYIATKAGEDPKIKKIFLALREKTPADFWPKLTDGFKATMDRPKVTVQEKPKQDIIIKP